MATLLPTATHPANGSGQPEVSIEDFFEQNIAQMDEQQLQDFDRAGEEIIQASRKRSADAAPETAR
jgi:hypothetical protein